MVDRHFRGGALRAAIAASVLIMATHPAAAQSASQEEANRATIAGAFEAWRTGTGGPYDLLAEDLSWTITGNSVAAKTYAGREAFMSEVIEPFNARMRSRLVPTVPTLFVDGDTVIAFFDAAGTALDGQIYANTYAWKLEMREGRIGRATAFFDSIAFDDLWRRVAPAGVE